MSEFAEKSKAEVKGKEPFGFTLIELLIVIVVLGILAAIVAFSLGGVTGQSAYAACQTDVRTVESAVQAYTAEFSGVSPTSQTQLTTPQTTPSGSTITFLNTWPSNPGHYSISLDATGGNITVDNLSKSPNVSLDQASVGNAPTALCANVS